MVRNMPASLELFDYAWSSLATSWASWVKKLEALNCRYFLYVAYPLQYRWTLVILRIFRTRAEEERRRRQIETLQSKLIHLQTQFADDNENSQRDMLFQKSAASLWEDDDDDVDDDVQLNRSGNSGTTSNGVSSGSGQQTNHDINDLRRQQNRLLEEQDDGLDALAKIISRQKHLALRIGDEVEEQNGNCNCDYDSFM